MRIGIQVEVGISVSWIFEDIVIEFQYLLHSLMYNESARQEDVLNDEDTLYYFVNNFLR